MDLPILWPRRVAWIELIPPGGARICVGDGERYTDACWYYPDAASALGALNSWDPSREPEPVGWLQSAA